MAFTDFGIESLIDLIRMHKKDPALLKRWQQPEQSDRGLRRMLTKSLLDLATEMSGRR